VGEKVCITPAPTIEEATARTSATTFSEGRDIIELERIEYPETNSVTFFGNKSTLGMDLAANIIFSDDSAITPGKIMHADFRYADEIKSANIPQDRFDAMTLPMFGPYEINTSSGKKYLYAKFTYLIHIDTGPGIILVALTDSPTANPFKGSSVAGTQAAPAPVMPEPICPPEKTVEECAEERTLAQDAKIVFDALELAQKKYFPNLTFGGRRHNVEGGVFLRLTIDKIGKRNPSLDAFSTDGFTTDGSDPYIVISFAPDQFTRLKGELIPIQGTSEKMYKLKLVRRSIGLSFDEIELDISPAELESKLDAIFITSLREISDGIDFEKENFYTPSVITFIDYLNAEEANPYNIIDATVDISISTPTNPSRFLIGGESYNYTIYTSLQSGTINEAFINTIDRKIENGADIVVLETFTKVELPNGERKIRITGTVYEEEINIKEFKKYIEVSYEALVEYLTTDLSEDDFISELPVFTPENIGQIYETEIRNKFTIEQASFIPINSDHSFTSKYSGFSDNRDLKEPGYSETVNGQYSGDLIKIRINFDNTTPQPVNEDLPKNGETVFTLSIDTAAPNQVTGITISQYNKYTYGENSSEGTEPFEKTRTETIPYTTKALQDYFVHYLDQKFTI
jgi:hypothetical protein